MSKIPVNQGKVWTRIEIDEVRRLASENLPTRIIGHEIGRSEGAVGEIAKRENIRLKPSKKSLRLRRS